MAGGAIYVESPIISTETAQSLLPTRLRQKKMATKEQERMEREGAEQNSNFPPNYMIGADENGEMVLHQSLIDCESETNEQSKGDLEKDGDLEKNQEQGKVVDKNQEDEGKIKDKEERNEFPGVQLTSKKRNSQYPIEEKDGKRDRVGLRSFSSSSEDLNRLFPLDSPNEVSFLSIELQTSTPRASSRGKQHQPPDSLTMEVRKELVSQDTDIHL